MSVAPRHAKPKTPVMRLRAPVLAPAGMPAMAVAAPALAVGAHAKPRTPVIRLRAPVVAPVVAAVALASVAAAFVSLHGGSAAAPSSHDAMAVTGAGAVSAGDRATTDVRTDVASAKAGTAATLAALRVHHAQQQAARQLAAKRQAQQMAAPPPSAAPPPPSTGGGDPAHSALGVCIRNAEEGGSYAWGPGNGGGAYQFLLSTWEAYGGAASEFGVAGPAYQDQIFDNAVNAGGASNWTAYDGC
jgi:Transglycosylase-like domain